MEIFLHVDGIVRTTKSHLDWLDDFIDWLESRNEYFGGGTTVEKILSIKEVVQENSFGQGFDGYEIKTDKQIIRLLIDNCQQCCESWGYFLSEDNVNDFVGANLIDITLTDTALNTKPMDECIYPDIDLSVIFVNLNTDRGVLQFVAYNNHNGYYGHTVKIISEQLNLEREL